MVNLSQHQQCHPVVVPRARVAGLDHHGALQLARGLLEQTPLLIQKPEIVVGLGVQLVPFEHRTIVLQRIRKVAGAMIVERQFQIVLSGWR